jgi:hypothetical protein
MQQWYKGSGPETAATTGKQGECQRSAETDPRAGDGKTNSRVFPQTPKNELQDTAEEPATAQA